MFNSWIQKVTSMMQSYEDFALWLNRFISGSLLRIIMKIFLNSGKSNWLTEYVSRNSTIFINIDKTATTNTGQSSARSRFGVASCVSPLDGFFKQQFIINLWRKYCPSSRFMVATFLFLISIASLIYLLYLVCSMLVNFGHQWKLKMCDMWMHSACKCSFFIWSLSLIVLVCTCCSSNAKGG